MIQDHAAGFLFAAKQDGTLTAIALTSYGTAGVGTGAGTAGPATNMYKYPNLLTEEYDVFINAGPGAAFRAPGHPQGSFITEVLMEELADLVKMDPVEFRIKNLPPEAPNAMQPRVSVTL